MTNPRKPSPPADLGVRGRKFWHSTVAAFELSDVEQELLNECCRLLDECESLRAAVDADGTTVTGSAGQTRVHPALDAPYRAGGLSGGACQGHGDVPSFLLDEVGRCA